MFLYDSWQCCIIEACGDGILWYNKVYIYAKNTWSSINAHHFQAKIINILLGVPRTICSLKNPIYWLQKIRFLLSISFHSSLWRQFDLYFLSSYFIKLLIEKKYALPYRVLDALVAHFMKFYDESRVMPVIWHQSLLAFAQRLVPLLDISPENDLVNISFWLHIVNLASVAWLNNLCRYKNELRKVDKDDLNALVERQRHKLVRSSAYLWHTDLSFFI